MPIFQSSRNYNIAKYFPLDNGKYQVLPGLVSLDKDFGNSIQDTHIFQIDKTFQHYRNNKIDARNDNLKKYYCTKNLPASHQQYLAQFIIKILIAEYPDLFSLNQCDKNQLLTCKLTNEQLLISNHYDLMHSSAIHYTNLIDGLVMQIQEDIAIISEDNHISCLHLMAPNYWSAQDKIGKSFSMIHQDVAGIELITKNSKAIIQAMIYRGPFVRFAWGITTDNKLNHHPNSTKADCNQSEYGQTDNEQTNSGRYFDPANPKLYLRVERQTINGLAKIKSALFTIRSYLYNIEDLTNNEIHCVINAIQSMTQKQLKYKGLTINKSAIIDWLYSIG